MASLDGHSLNVKIDRLNKEVLEEISKLKLMFAELYRYIATIEESKAPKEKKKETKDARKSMRPN